MVRDELSVMSAFLAGADEKSFTKAAKRLGDAIRAQPRDSRA
jgi:DNA-binding transcriptional LysR family regulator